jgi:hypothetical protein
VELLANPNESQMNTSGTTSNNEGNTKQTPSTTMPRRSGRNTHAPSYLDDYYVFLGEVHSKVSNLEEDPRTYKEAVSCPQSKLWVEAIREELNSMKKNKVWELVSLPNICKAIGCKWILKRKVNAMGQVEKYKARLVAKGFAQRGGVDFVKTFLLLQNVLLYVLLVI